MTTASTTNLDPEDLPSNPAFTQGVIAPAAPTLYVGGQLGTTGDPETWLKRWPITLIPESHRNPAS
jgi:hypothetical protein